MIRRAFELISDMPDAADLLLGRPRRHAQGAGERAEPGDAARAPAAAADQRAGPLRGVRELRRAQQRHAAPLPRHLRLRVRVRQRHRLLSLGAVRRGAAARGRALRRDHGGHAREPARGAAADLFVLPADLAADRPGALRADEGGERPRRHDHLRRRGRHRDDAAGDRRQREAAVEARLRGALGGARRRLRDVRQGPLDQHADLRLDLRDPRRAGAEPLHLRAVPRREGREDLEVEGQRPDDRRVARATRARRASPTSCTASRRRRSGSTST